MRLVQLLSCRRGATAVEYGLILALIVLAIMATLRALADSVVALWGDVSGTVARAIGF